MEIFQVVGLGLTATLIVVLLKQARGQDIALLVSIITGAVIFILLLDRLGVVVRLLAELAERAGINQLYLGTLLKIIGIAYVAEFGAQVCRDAGDGAVGEKIEMAAKVLILVLAVPILAAILETIMRLLG